MLLAVSLTATREKHLLALCHLDAKLPVHGSAPRPQRSE